MSDDREERARSLRVNIEDLRARRIHLQRLLDRLVDDVHHEERQGVASDLGALEVALSDAESAYRALVWPGDRR